MKRFTSIFIFLIFYISSFSQTSLSNPLYLLNSLIDCPSEKQMKEVCQGHNFTELSTDGDFTVYESTDGTVIRFKVEKEDGTGKTTPFVEVLTTLKEKQIEKILSDLGFKKKGSEYIKGSEHARRHTACHLTKLVGNKTLLHCTKK